jgi:hypothetical protein
MQMHCFYNQVRRTVKEVFCAGTGILLVPMILAVQGIGSKSFSQVPIDLSGKVTTKQGTVAFDVVLTLLDAKISDTADTDGKYHFLGQTTALSRNGQLRSRQQIKNCIVGKTICIGGYMNDRLKDGDELLIDLHGRIVSPARMLLGQSKKVPDGVYFRYRGLTSEAAFGSSRQSFIATATDTISISYQGTFLKKVPVTSLNGTLNIELGIDLPARKHSALVASYSNNKAYILSTDNQVEWEYGMPGPVQDAWLLPNGNILLCGGGDVREVTRSKQVIWKYSASAGEIHNCYPLPGDVVLFGENISGKLIEINRTTNTVVRTIQTQCQGDSHLRFRMVRKTRDSTYLVAARGEDNVYEFSKTGAVLRKINCISLKTKYGINWDGVHSAIKLENGNILIGGGYNSVFVELDKKDSIVWKLSAADIPEIGFNFAAAGQLLPGGTFVFGAYTSNYKLVEVTRAKKVIWKLQNSTIGNPTHVYITDCWGTGAPIATACDPSAPETLVR